MQEAVFFFCVGSLVLSNALLVASIIRPESRLWPPPSRGSPHYRLTRIIGVLSPLTVVGAFALGILDWEGTILLDAGRFVAGGALFALGGAFALWGYFGLGARASQGHFQGLLATGAYRYSRNPQYVGTIVCLFGYSVLCASAMVLGVWALWTVWFLMAPCAEEPWLREQLGAAYDEYASEVPRFIGWRGFASRRAV
jgi:protein-S-isoprenylcysteine O-methyltransferase Ste14